MNTEPINADPKDLAYFALHAPSWWDPKGELRPLHDINAPRLQWARTEADLAGKAALDIGCGGGIFAESLAAAGARVTGIDLSPDVLEVARLHLLESGLEVDYRQASAEDLARQSPGAFDVVSCLEMLEHVPNPGSVVKAVAALLKPGGTALFSTVNRTAKAYLLAIVGAERVLKLLPAGTHEFSRFLRPSELSRFCRDAGLAPKPPCGIDYNPLLGICRLSGNASVNYLLSARKPG